MTGRDASVSRVGAACLQAASCVTALCSGMAPGRAKQLVAARAPRTPRACACRATMCTCTLKEGRRECEAPLSSNGRQGCMRSEKLAHTLMLLELGCK